MVLLRPFTLLFLLALAPPVRAQQAGLNFLSIGVDAAAGAMGDTQVALSRDAFSTYWNPAGLAAATGNLAALSHQNWIADVRTYALAARFRAGERGGLGLFAGALTSGDLATRDIAGPPVGQFTAQYLSIGAAYGRTLGPLRAGIGLKYINEQLFAYSANGYAFDAGLQAEALRGALRVGAAIQNVGRMSQLDAVATPLPRRVRAGLAVQPLRILAEDDGTPLLGATFTAEVAHLFAQDDGEGRTSNLGRTQVHLGAAAEVLELVIVRAGLITNNAARRLTFGAGLGYGPFLFDYAFIPFREGFGTAAHVLTLSYGW